MTSGETVGRTEAAQRLGVSERTLDRYVGRDLLTPRRNPVTGRVAFDADEVEALRRQREGLPPA